jgi:hypothetical protein
VLLARGDASDTFDLLVLLAGLAVRLFTFFHKLRLTVRPLIVAVGVPFSALTP